MSRHIAFYGTLKSDGDTPMHSEIRNKLKYVGPCMITGALYDLGRYPGLKPGGGKVKGELYEVIDESVLSILDQYESSDSKNPSSPGFERKLLNLEHPKLQAWVYCYKGEVDENKRIASGQWT